MSYNDETEEEFMNDFVQQRLFFYKRVLQGLGNRRSQCRCVHCFIMYLTLEDHYKKIINGYLNDDEYDSDDDLYDFTSLSPHCFYELLKMNHPFVGVDNLKMDDLMDNPEVVLLCILREHESHVFKDK